MLVAKMRLTHLKTVIQLLKAINFKEVFKLYLCSRDIFSFSSFCLNKNNIDILYRQPLALAVKMG